MNDLLKSLPDFDDMDKVAKIISDSKAELEDKKNRLDEYVATCVRTAMTDKNYWINNKPPSMDYIEKVVTVHGNTDEDARILSELREQIVNLMKQFQESKMVLDNMKDRIAVWQTHSANHRKVMG
jgi:hypothetical protein